MQTELVQSLRYKLQKRIRRLNTATPNLLHLFLQQFWGFLEAQPLLSGVAGDLARRHPLIEGEAEKVLKRKGLAFPREEESAALGYFVLKKCAQSDDDRAAREAGIAYGGGHLEDWLQNFRVMFLEPFSEYLDEQLDDQRLLLSLLVRYKHKCEWFRSEELLRMATADSGRAERNLAEHMYEYLYDQGLDFSVEPRSASGKPDLVSAQTGDRRLVADTKVFGEGTAKTYLASAFNQVYTYARDYNEPFGYIVLFNTSGRDVKFVLDAQEQSVSFHCHNGKTIFIMTIDVSRYAKTASKRGPLASLEVTAQDLVQLIQTETTKEVEAS
ncbi:MAG: hypothetical protein NTX53_19495 [candidate division WOR-3 bacterium]|nr:hypothetical protein [candidate division WOR-3 bacterium]